MSASEDHVVVIGGGIAGVSFTETFARLCPNVRVTLVSASPELKVAHVTSTTGRLMQQLDVHEVSSSSLIDSLPNVDFVMDRVVSMDPGKHTILTSCGKTIAYSYACICTGARPAVIPGCQSHVLSIRDTQSVDQLQRSLANSRRVVVVGNGGIATELVFQVTHCQIIWVIRDKSISSAYFDPVSAQFMINSLTEGKKERAVAQQQLSRKLIASADKVSQSNSEPGSALGPDWSFGREFAGRSKEASLVIEYETEVTCVRDSSAARAGDDAKEQEDYPVVVELSSGKQVPCDIIISATGVFPSCQIVTHAPVHFCRHPDDDGLLVNEDMETSIKDVFAAGDVCSVDWKEESDRWFQMRLWTQAHQMGTYAAHSVAARFTALDHKIFFNFDVFTHVTSFFGHKVILIGLFKGQKLENFKILLKVEEGKQFVKLVLKDGRVKGAILIGDTGLEETIENLVISQLDVSRIEDNLLDAGIDIEDYFD